MIVCIPQVSLICKTGHPHDTSHNRSHSLSHPQPSEPRLEVCTSLKKPLSFSIDTDPEWVGVCTGASLIIETSAHGVWAIILIILYREAGVGAEGREGRAT